MTTAATTPSPAAEPPAHGLTPGTARAALSYPKFRLVFIGLALSQIGTWMQNVTLPAYIQDRTGSPALVGVTIAVQLGPLLFLSIPGGALADKVSKQKLMLWMQSISAVLTLGTAYFVARDASSAPTSWSYLLPVDHGIRVDSGAYQGYRIPPYYDSLIGKLIVHGKTRNECMMRLKRALSEFVIDGIETTIPLFHELVRHPDVVNGMYDIHWLEKYLGKS